MKDASGPIVEHERVHLSPSFACDYEARSKLGAFFMQGVYRGTTFVDGHLRRESRFYLGAIAFFPASLAAVALLVRWGRLHAVRTIVGVGVFVLFACRALTP